MSYVLIVEDSKTMRMHQELMLDKAGVAFLEAVDFDSLNEVLYEFKEEISVAIVDLNIPGAEDGQSVDLLLGLDIPVVVFTATCDLSLMDRLCKKGVITCLTKDDPYSFDFAARFVQELSENIKTNILVVDDSKTYRLHVASILRKYGFSVETVSDGKAAVKSLKENNKISLVITDEVMPNMDGISLVRHIRKSYDKEIIGILGISGADSRDIHVRYLKSGANDFIKKPFGEDEFINRAFGIIGTVNAASREKEKQDALEVANKQIHALNEELVTLASEDPLMRIGNRRAMEAELDRIHKGSKRHGQQYSIVLYDVDHFKDYNDHYGHSDGDEALIKVANHIKSSIRGTDRVFRYGGEEILLLLPQTGASGALALSQRIIIGLADQKIPHRKSQFNILTMSGGLGCYDPDSFIDSSWKDVVNRADDALYRAKDRGRNQMAMVRVEPLSV